MENRSAMPMPSEGRCAISVSKKFSPDEYGNFIAGANKTFGLAWCMTNLWVWDEGYPNWWLFSNVKRLPSPIPCRGKVGMWQPGPDLSAAVSSAAEFPDNGIV